MLDEPTTLASVARLIGESLERDYGIDPGPVFRDLDIDPGRLGKPGSRVAFRMMTRLWDRAVELSEDPWMGFAVGRRAMPGDFYVLGQAWLSSASLAGALRRLCRFRRVVTTLTGQLRLDETDGEYELVRVFPDDARKPHKAARDAGFVAFLRMCDFVTGQPVRPLGVTLTLPPDRASSRYEELFGCPVAYGGDREILRFAAADLERPLTGSIPELAQATDQIAERYIDSLDRSKVSTAVRQMLVQTLPAGRSDQDTIAKRLYRSRSTLQRQLSAEGTSYREILESTRLDLAKQYLLDGRYSQAQIAFMVGFSDQSNFARAFRRWTGLSPGDFQKAA